MDRGSAQSGAAEGKAEAAPGQKPREKKSEKPTRGSRSAAHVVLGVRADADEATIRSAYRKLCATYHPDKFAQAPKREQDQANRRMTEINARMRR